MSMKTAFPVELDPEEHMTRAELEALAGQCFEKVAVNYTPDELDRLAWNYPLALPDEHHGEHGMKSAALALYETGGSTLPAGRRPLPMPSRMLSKIDSALCPVIFILSYAKIYLVLCQCIPPWPSCIGGARMPLAAADWPVAQSVEQIAANLVTVRQRIADACARVGRDPASVRLLPVSKTVDDARIRMAVAAGCRELGENKVQEAQRKAETMADLGVHWSVIGHLQTNKARYVARFASEFQALDSLRVAEALQQRLQLEDRTLDVFVQVNTSAEPSKYGLEPDAVEAFVQQLPAFDRLRVRGLMTLAIFTPDVERVRACFVRLRELRGQLQRNAPPGLDLSQLSMGMSGDFEVAIEEGATVVRVGQAIFGARATPDSFYWPNSGAPA